MSRRVRGTGRLFKRNGKWVYQYRDITGKLKTMTLYKEGQAVLRKSEAQTLISEKAQELLRAQQLESKAEYLSIVATTKKLITLCPIQLSGLGTAFLNHPNRTDGQIPKKRAAIQDLSCFVHKHYPAITYIRDVTEKIAGEYLQFYWNSGISEASYNNRLKCLRMVFGLFLRTDNPFLPMKTKDEVGQSREAFTVEELQSIWEKLSDDAYYMLHKSEMKTLYILALHTGLRCGDLCLLKWAEVNFSQRVISLVLRKTKASSQKRVHIPINDTLLTVLTGCSHDSDYVLPHVALRYQKNRYGIYKDTTALLEASGIRTKEEPDNIHRKRSIVRYGFHSFRHTFASLLMNSGTNQVTVSRLLGHTSLDMTNRYLHVADTAIIQAVNSLPALENLNEKQKKCGSKNDALHPESGMREILVWIKNNLADTEKMELSRILSTDFLPQENM